MHFDFSAFLDDTLPGLALDAGQTIFEMGDAGQSMYVVRTGRAEIRLGNRVLDVIDKGGTLGEMALLDDTVRSATAVAVTPCEIVAIDKSRLLDMVCRHPLLALELTRSMVRRLRTMNHHAQYDLLTDLPNRMLFQAQAQGVLDRATHFRHAVALLHIGIDNFDIVNSSLGFDAGDQILMAIAERLQAWRHPASMLARIGADEFGILIEGDDDAADLAQIAQMLLAALREPMEVAGKSLYVTASIGITRFPQDGDSVAALLKNSDMALHAAKAQGRDRYAFFSEVLSSDAHEFLTLNSAMRAGLEAEQFSLHYQPRVELGSGRILSVEALIRWQHPELGFVSPGRFIPVAEESGLIERIGHWVLREGCRQQKAWLDAGIAPERMAINLSARQLAVPGFVDILAKVLADSGLPPERLELEITEGALLNDPQAVAEKLRIVRDMGITVALDDFGTGFSSLSYLKRLPLDSLKIDQSFVRGIPTDGHDVAITRSIIAMAGNLNLKTVVEGVETEAQLAFARAEGCGEFQGYLFSKPLPAERVEHLLRAARTD